MRGLCGEELLRLPVRLRGIVLGWPADVILHPSASTVLGLDVVCGDERHRFLPASAAKVGEEEIEVGSPFVLLDPSAGSVYGTLGRALSTLRGVRVGEDEGVVLDDVLVGPGWTIEGLALQDRDGRRRVAPGRELALGFGGGRGHSGANRSRKRSRSSAAATRPRRRSPSG